MDISPDFYPELEASGAASGAGEEDPSQKEIVQETNFPSAAGKSKNILRLQKDASMMLQLEEKPGEPSSNASGCNSSVEDEPSRCC